MTPEREREIRRIAKHTGSRVVGELLTDLDAARAELAEARARIERLRAVADPFGERDRLLAELDQARRDAVALWDEGERLIGRQADRIASYRKDLK